MECSSQELNGKKTKITNALTIDVEDYYQVSAFDKVIPRSDWGGPKYASRIRSNTLRILEMLDQFQTKATFFVLGWVAENYPRLVEEIEMMGHEVGCHSYWHNLIYRQSPEEFREDLRRSTHSIEDAIGKKVTVYRAPSFSITRKSLWAFEILVEEGYEIDSSVFPIRHDRYGIPSANLHPYTVQTKSGNLTEFPMSVHQYGKVNIPIAGGGYFRLFPYTMVSRWMRLFNQRHQKPFVFYIHPWEFDTEQPRVRNAGLVSRFRHYQNLSKTEWRFKFLLSHFNFQTITQTLNQQSEMMTEERPIQKEQTAHVPSYNGSSPENALATGEKTPSNF